MKTSRWALLAVIIVSIALFFTLDLQQYLTLDALKSRQASIEAYRSDHPLLAAVIYTLIYIGVTGLSLPGATLLTLAGGAVFGLLWGTVIVSFASTIGATLSFLMARFLFRDAVKARFGDRLKTANKGLNKDEALYLFTLRLVPAFPFFVINLVMGLTSLNTMTFYWISQIGMLPGTIVYVNAGTQLGRIESLSGILSPGLIGSFVLLGVFPLMTKKVVDAINARKVFKAWIKPPRFEQNIVVIGAGAAGLVASYVAAASKAKVALIEKHKMGGDCLNTGCVPSKTLIRSAKLLALMRRSEDFGIKTGGVDIDFSEVMNRVKTVIKTIEPHDSVQRYADLGVEVIEGEAQVISPWEVQVKTNGESRIITTRSIIIAAGSRPLVPPIPGLEEIGYLTSDIIWDLSELPKRLLVLGGGPIGCELAQSFARLGSKVTLIEKLPRLLMREDADVSEAVMTKFREEGIVLFTGHTAKSFMVDGGEKILLAEHDGMELRLPFDQVLVALGRAANIQGYGLEQLGVEITPGRTIEIDECQQTNYPNIFACGDVSGPYQFTHVSAHQAWYASVNALMGGVFKFRTDYSAIPWATFTDPEVARVGLNEQEAKAKDIAYEVTSYALNDLDRAITDGVAQGFVKVLTAQGTGRILGATIVGEQAGELIAEYVLAIKHKIGLNKLLATIHIYPTLAEANKYAAGAWKRKHLPQRLLWLAERYHQWRRG
ncbi:MAG: FAD-dependent oxidoreductase [Methylobacter sp.]